MAGRRLPQLLMLASFLAIIAAVPVGQAVIELRQNRTPQALDVFTRSPTDAHLREYEDELEDRSWFAGQLRPWMQYARFVAVGDTGAKAMLGRDGWWFYRPDVRYLFEPCPTDDGHHTGPEAVVSAVVSYRDKLAERGIQLLVVPVPGKPSVYPDKLTRRAKPELLDSAHTHHVIDLLRAANVEVVDLSHAFPDAQTADPDTGPLYLQRDTHWTPAGARLAAEAVADRLVETGWIERGTTAYTIRPVTVQRPGDVLEMLRTPRIERRYEPEAIPCEQVVLAGPGEPYRDDPASPILVLGDSFLRIYERDEPGSAGFIAHLARALGRPVASIVNDGGASTLVRQELARKPSLLAGKTLVVWEFVERDIRFGLDGWQDVPLPPAVAAP